MCPVRCSRRRADVPAPPLRPHPTPTVLAYTRPIPETLKGYARGVAGGLIFSIAPLYTMELWWQGYSTPPLRMLATGVGMLFVLLAFAHYAGVHESASILDDIIETFQIVAISTIIAAVVLKLAGQLPSSLSFYDSLTRVVGEGACVAIGVAVGSTQLGENPNQDQNEARDQDVRRGGILHELAFAVLGAFLIAAGIAPTLEITMVAAVANPWGALILAFLTLLLALLVVNYSKFRGSSRLSQGIFYGGPFGDAVVTYAIGLFTAAAMLWVTGAFDAYGITLAVYQTVFLAVATTLGASAGRLLLT